MKKSSLKTNFGSTVRSRRTQLGISQEELAEQARLHRTYISDIERGARNLSLESICKLAEALQVTVAELFSPSIEQPATADSNLNGNKFVDVLLVEDNPDDVTMTLRAFKQARFSNRVHVARDGEEALEYLAGRDKDGRREGHPQLILLDLNLPRVSGIEVLRRIKADKKTRAIPVVVLTVSQRGRDIEDCLRLGVENYIVKPVDLQRLIQVTPKFELNWGLFKPSLAAPASGPRRTAPH